MDNLLEKRLGIVSLENNWHGRTMGSQMMSGNLKKKNGLAMKIKIFIIFSSLTLGL